MLAGLSVLGVTVNDTPEITVSTVSVAEEYVVEMVMEGVMPTDAGLVIVFIVRIIPAPAASAELATDEIVMIEVPVL